MKKLLCLLALTGLLTSCGTSSNTKNVVEQHLNENSGAQTDVTPPQKF